MRKARAWKYLKVAVAIGGLVALLSAAIAAGATRFIAGNLILDVGMDFAPKTFPHTHDAPLKLWGHEKVQMKDGSVPPPTTHLAFEFNKNGHVDTRGLPTCTKQKLIATTTAQAIRSCSGAIVGRGYARVVIAFPEQTPLPASTSLLVFNAPPIDGEPTFIVHGHLDVPAPTTYLERFRITRIDKGSLGYRVEADHARIAGGYGSVLYFRFSIGREWHYKGERVSYLNAHCPVPDVPRLLVRAETRFADGTAVKGSLFALCHAR
jgi:hypothetical protein